MTEETQKPKWKVVIYGEWTTKEWPLEEQDLGEAKMEAEGVAIENFVDGYLGWSVLPIDYGDQSDA